VLIARAAPGDRAAYRFEAARMWEAVGAVLSAPSPLAASLAQSYSWLISIGELNSGAGKNFFDCLQALWITGVTANFNIVDCIAVKPGRFR
jgi:hypothetical protein